MISEAMQHGYSKRSPEPGIHYLVMSTQYKPDYSVLFEGISQPIIHMLNEAKNEQMWGCYFPFTLSIMTPESLYAFLRGDIYIIVVFDAAELIRVAREKGLSLTFLNDELFAYQFEKVGEGISDTIPCKVSRHFAMRIAYEFLSWKWVLDTHQQQIESCKAWAASFSQTANRE